MVLAADPGLTRFTPQPHERFPFAASGFPGVTRGDGLVRGRGALCIAVSQGGDGGAGGACG